VTRSSPGGGRAAGIAGKAVPALLIAVAVYYAVWGGEYSVFDVRTMTHRQRAAEAELLELEREVDSLEATEELLENDPATIEAVARERFGMVRDGELLYRFIEVDSASRP
jgi:cell division protein FtsB